MGDDLTAEIRSAIQRIGDRIKVLGDRVATVEQTASARAVSLPGVDGSGKGEESFSFARYAWARRTGDWSIAPYEKEVLDQTRKKALAAGSGAGSDLVPTEVVAEIVPLLRSRMIVDRLRMTRMSGLSGSPVQIPRQTGTSTGYWVGENAAITASDTDDDLVSLTPNKAAGLSKLSNTMLRTGIASGTIEQYVRDDLSKQLARTIQTAIFNGSGTSNQPTGVLNVSGINTVDLSSTTTKASLVTGLQNMIKELEIDDVDVANDTVAWVMHPRAFHKLAQLLRDADTEIPVLTGPGIGDIRSSQDPAILLGYPYHKTSDMPLEVSPSDTDILLCKWDEVIFADWGSMELAVSTEADTAFAYDQTWIRIIQEVDVAAMHPVAICAGRDFLY